jgi:hypothetical protein
MRRGWLDVAEDVNFCVLLEGYSLYMVSGTTCTTFSFS